MTKEEVVKQIEEAAVQRRHIAKAAKALIDAAALVAKYDPQDAINRLRSKQTAPGANDETVMGCKIAIDLIRKNLL